MDHLLQIQSFLATSTKKGPNNIILYIIILFFFFFFRFLCGIARWSNSFLFTFSVLLLCKDNKGRPSLRNWWRTFLQTSVGLSFSFIFTTLCTWSGYIWAQKHFIEIRRTSCFGLKCIFLVGTNMAGNCLRSPQKYLQSPTVVTGSTFSPETPPPFLSPPDLEVRS